MNVRAFSLLLALWAYAFHAAADPQVPREINFSLVPFAKQLTQLNVRQTFQDSRGTL